MRAAGIGHDDVKIEWTFVGERNCVRSNLYVCDVDVKINVSRSRSDPAFFEIGTWILLIGNGSKSAYVGSITTQAKDSSHSRLPTTFYKCGTISEEKNDSRRGT